MKKIPTMFDRNPDKLKEILNQPHPDCGWVFSGEGVATRKYDGSCCLVQDGVLYRRREVKRGKATPENFILADYDEVTRKSMGWVPVDSKNPQDRWHVEAYACAEPLSTGTYELIGPKVQGNPEQFSFHTLVSHEHAIQFADAPRTYDDLAEWLKDKDIEGLVFHHPDGRMAKIKKRDFGQKRFEHDKLT